MHSTVPVERRKLFVVHLVFAASTSDVCLEPRFECSMDLMCLKVERFPASAGLLTRAKMFLFTSVLPRFCVEMAPQSVPLSVDITVDSGVKYSSESLTRSD